MERTQRVKSESTGVRKKSPSKANEGESLNDIDEKSEPGDVNAGNH